VNEEQANQIIAELEALKKLHLLSLMERGFSQQQLATALGVSQPTISRMVPATALGKDKRKA
jgi:predicted XRE-type DNA-binding protein